MIRIGVVGHRWLTAGGEAFVAASCAAILRTAVERLVEIGAVSAIAEGADTIFAREAVALSLPLEIVRPFATYAEDFGDHTRADYDRLRAHAVMEEALPFASRSTDAYVAGMRWVVNRSDVLVAIWDGRPAHGEGGTAQAVETVTAAHRPWIHVDVTGQCVRGYVDGHSAAVVDVLDAGAAA